MSKAKYDPRLDELQYNVGTYRGMLSPYGQITAIRKALTDLETFVNGLMVEAVAKAEAYKGKK